MILILIYAFALTQRLAFVIMMTAVSVISILYMRIRILIVFQPILVLVAIMVTLFTRTKEFVPVLPPTVTMMHVVLQAGGAF